MVFAFHGSHIAIGPEIEWFSSSNTLAGCQLIIIKEK